MAASPVSPTRASFFFCCDVDEFSACFELDRLRLNRHQNSTHPPSGLLQCPFILPVTFFFYTYLNPNVAHFMQFFFFLQCSCRSILHWTQTRCKIRIKNGIFVFSTFGIFLVNNSDIVDGQAGAKCKTCLQVSCKFTDRHLMSVPIFR